MLQFLMLSVRQCVTPSTWRGGTWDPAVPGSLTKYCLASSNLDDPLTVLNVQFNFGEDNTGPSYQSIYFPGRYCTDVLVVGTNLVWHAAMRSHGLPWSGSPKWMIDGPTRDSDRRRRW